MLLYVYTHNATPVTSSLRTVYCRTPNLHCLMKFLQRKEASRRDVSLVVSNQMMVYASVHRHAAGTSVVESYRPATHFLPYNLM